MLIAHRQCRQTGSGTVYMCSISTVRVQVKGRGGEVRERAREPCYKTGERKGKASRGCEAGLYRR